MNTPWVGFDLDGTIARYDGWVDERHIGAPIQPMIDLIKTYIAEGTEVRIFTARVGEQGRAGVDMAQVRADIEAWCEEHIGQRLPVTNIKDFGMVWLYDDRAIGVERNTGRLIGDVVR